MKRLALDHLTAIDTTPIHLAQTARAVGCDGMCLFMEPMDVLPLMPKFDICGDPVTRAELKSVMRDLGVSLDLAYPFTLTGRTDVAAFATAMECAAELGAGMINALLYDRDPARRLDTFARFCDMADGFGLRVGVEFYPPSQVPSLAAALDLVGQVARPERVGINVDLLHLIRSGGTIGELAAVPAGYVLYGQVADGPALAPEDPGEEASSERLLCGQGAFDVAGFVRALPEGCPISVEIPRNHAVGTETTATRARRAVDSARAATG
ncbi:sugar phosphate isomerase/epimerase family protein [Novosphingobium taihuense]|uniref:Sugar phosphate isomerase/epimerase n=1 Tax=Novosphingobium taihuense TaxID=260085 RepID=A0A7W7EU60_9SPHN|nr:TIM barrel protein [Novosphingobium taihuense]MBB4613937.1 sugar phosphate isomerase/epimerase [Novosphingobium taihuense]TWH86788.1 sugar phosphate isomerase/epimerase [Novosphingobium taihuense]